MKVESHSHDDRGSFTMLQVHAIGVSYAMIKVLCLHRQVIHCTFNEVCILLVLAMERGVSLLMHVTQKRYGMWKIGLHQLCVSKGTFHNGINMIASD